MDDAPPPEKTEKAETLRRWIATIATVISALSPVVVELVRRWQGS